MRIDIQKRQGACFIDVAFHGDGNGIVGLFGPSGAGKTSIIQMVAGLQQPDSGSISIRGRCLFDSARAINLPPEKRKIGYVFQEDVLFPHMSVQANLLYGQRANGQRANAPADGIHLEHIIHLLGIEPLLSRRPKTLSSGEKQRVAFGRAVLANPDILLMDEPLASLDEARKEEMLPFIKTLNTRFGLPILYVSHALEEILTLTHHVVRLANGKIQLPG